jgi:Predicted membrane protein
MSGSEASLAISVFLASAVEAVEAFTIVLAVGSTRKWSSALLGVAGASFVLACLVAGLGPALTVLPIGALRLLVGGLLLVFGLQWLRKAILRAGGAKALHDEIAAFERESAAAQGAALGEGVDAYAFAISFKATLLEGLEVAFIVLTFGANQHDIPLAALAAVAALVAVIAAGLAARAPLARVPENSMKFAVGVLLTSFGIFWGAEGAGASWPGGEAALPALVLTILAASWLMVRDLRREVPRLAPEPS